MQLKDITHKKLNTKKRVGRGGSRGKTSGSGMNGQKSRSGANLRPAERDFIKKIPKKRGYRFNSVRNKIFSINISSIEKRFKSGEEVSPKTLFEKGLISKNGGKYPSVKLLGNGDVSKKLLVSGCGISESAKEKVTKAGGEVK